MSNVIALKPSVVVTERTITISDTIQQAIDIKREISALDAEYKELTNNIKAHMCGIDKSELIVNNKLLATYKTESRNTLDSKRLKAELPDVYSMFTKTSESRKLLIK